MKDFVSSFGGFATLASQFKNTSFASNHACTLKTSSDETGFKYTTHSEQNKVLSCADSSFLDLCYLSILFNSLGCLGTGPVGRAF